MLANTFTECYLIENLIEKCYQNNVLCCNLSNVEFWIINVSEVFGGRVIHLCYVFQEHDRQYMHIGTMVEFAFALVGKLDVINKHSFNDFKLRVGESEQKD